jgi:hypothetical protein
MCFLIVRVEGNHDVASTKQYNPWTLRIADLVQQPTPSTASD